MDFCNTHPVNTVVKEPLTDAYFSEPHGDRLNAELEKLQKSAKLTKL